MSVRLSIAENTQAVKLGVQQVENTQGVCVMRRNRFLLVLATCLLPADRCSTATTTRRHSNREQYVSETAATCPGTYQFFAALVTPDALSDGADGDEFDHERS